MKNHPQSSEVRLRQELTSEELPAARTLAL